MRPSEFIRGISEIDVALGRLMGFTCTEEGCEGMWATCNNRDMEIAREVLNRLRKLGLPDLLAELGKVVGRQVTVDDICVFTEINWLYSDCVLSETASKERCREKLRRALEGARKRLEKTPELKKRLAGLLGKLGTVGRFKLDHSFPIGFPTGVTVLELPLGSCGTLGLRHNLPRKYFEAAFHYPHEGPLARELRAWLAEYVGEMLRGLGVNKYETITVYGEVKIQLSAPDPGTGFDLLETFVDLALVLNETCVALPMRRVAEKTGVRVKV